jgi:hypothetical protein
LTLQYDKVVFLLKPIEITRELCRKRVTEGKQMGRPPSLTPAQQKEATRRRAQGATLQELADSYTGALPPCAAPRAPHEQRFGVAYLVARAA